MSFASVATLITFLRRYRGSRSQSICACPWGRVAFPSIMEELASSVRYGGIGIWRWQLPTSKYFEEEKIVFSLQIQIVHYWFVSTYMGLTDNQLEILLINVFSSMSISAGCLFNIPLGLLYQISLRAENLRWECMYLLYPTISLEGFATQIF